MKKTKKLHVSRETIRKLSAHEIRQVVGGRNNLSQYGVCLPSEQNTACDACITDVC
jgi:natural product precursor